MGSDNDTAEHPSWETALPEGTPWVYRHHLEELRDALWDADLRDDEGPLVTAARRLVQRIPPPQGGR